MDKIPFLAEWIRRARVSDSAAIHRLYQVVRGVYRVLGRTAWFLHLGWVNSIRRINRTADGWTVQGWAYHRGTDFGPDREFRAWLTRRGRKIALDVTTGYDMDARAAARAAEFDYALNSFEAVIPDAVLEGLPRGSRWRLHLELRGNGHRVRGPAQSVSSAGSAVVARLQRHDGGGLVGPLIEAGSGLSFVHERVVVDAVEVTTSGSEVEVHVRPTSGERPSAARWVCREDAQLVETHQMSIEAADDTWILRSDRPHRGPGDYVVGSRREAWQVEVEIGGRWHRVTAAEQLTTHESPHGVWVREANSGAVEVLWVPVVVVVGSLDVLDDATRVGITGTWSGAAGVELEFRSRFVTLPVSLELGDDGTFEAFVDLSVSRWNGPSMAPPNASYVLVARLSGGTHPTFISDELGDGLPLARPTVGYYLRVVAAGRDQLALRLAASRTEAEFGAWRQNQLREQFALAEAKPLEAVYLESFFGRNATCNPMAIDAEIARQRPDLPRYWGVKDLSFEVPPGAIPVVFGTTEWWRVRGSARWLVSNEWLRANFAKKSFQTVLQTWHGSMYKQIGLDRVGRGRAHLKVVGRELAKWDMFVSQSPETTPIIRSAYGLDEQIIEIGYPRNDELFTADDQVRADLRRHLGIAEDVTVVLYAPTWREAVQEDVELLDLERLGPIVGPTFQLLRRGHVRALRNMSAAGASNVLDVSTYPQINDLLQVADVLITDYSSMMFDFSVTGRPMIFYTPDIDQYTDTQVRGSYFDLEERAPGPVTREVSEVIRLIRTLDTWPAQWSQRYEAWQQRYNVLDDGRASARAVEALWGFEPSRTVSDDDLELDGWFASETEGPLSEGRSLDSDVDDDPDIGAEPDEQDRADRP